MFIDEYLDSMTISKNNVDISEHLNSMATRCSGFRKGTFEDLMKEIIKHAISYWKSLKEEYGYPNVRFDNMTTSAMLVQRVMYLVQLGNGITPDIAASAVLTQFVSDELIGCEGLQTINAGIQTEDGFVYNTHTIMTSDKLFKDCVKCHKDVDLLFDLMDLELRHEFGHAIVYNKRYGDCKTVDEFLERLKMDKPTIMNEHAICSKHINVLTDEDERMRLYYSMSDEKSANDAVGLTVNDFIEINRRVNATKDIYKFDIPGM